MDKKRRQERGQRAEQISEAAMSDYAAQSSAGHCGPFLLLKRSAFWAPLMDSRRTLSLLENYRRVIAVHIIVKRRTPLPPPTEGVVALISRVSGGVGASGYLGRPSGWDGIPAAKSSAIALSLAKPSSESERYPAKQRER